MTPATLPQSAEIAHSRTSTTFSTVPSALVRHARVDPHGAAVRFAGTTVTWSELLDRASRIAAALAAAGVGPGDRVALLVSNSPAFVDSLVATHLLRAIAVPINARLSAPEVEFILGDLEPAALVVDGDLLSLTASVPKVATFINYAREGLELPGSAQLLDDVQVGVEPLDPDTLPAVDPGDVGYILYTSGTTGRPKGAKLTHANLTASSWISTTMNGLIGSGDVRYIATPLFHIAALSAVVGGLLMGATSILATSGDFDAEPLLDVLENEEVTHLFLVPTQWEAVLSAQSLPTRTLKVRAVTWGASPLAGELLRRMTAALPGVRVNSTLGQTEMSGVTVFYEGLAPPERAGTVGLPAFSVDVRVVDDAMGDVPVGQVGEIVYRGPTTMLGYWRRDEANKADGTPETLDLDRTSSSIHPSSGARRLAVTDHSHRQKVRAWPRLNRRTNSVLPEGTFDNRVAVVTGGGSGIGAAIALELARLGASVALLGRRQERADAVASEIEGNGGQAKGYSVDVRRRDAVEATLSRIVTDFDKVDHLVNSAAGNFKALPQDLSANAWNSVVDIVLDGTWNCTQSVGRHLIERGSPGSVLNIGSNMARFGGPGTVHSASAKAAVLAMSKSLGAAWGPFGIRVNTLIPGPVADTAGVAVVHGTNETINESVPLGRSASKLEVANAAAYLLSDYADYVTGTELVIDGGRSLGRD